VADRVHAWVHASESIRTKPVLDRAPRHAKVQELAPGNDAVLSPRHPRDRFIVGSLLTDVDLPTHEVRESTSVHHRRDRDSPERTEGARVCRGSD
jgi:hypothetical protein